MECTDLERGSVHPISVHKFNENEADESSIVYVREAKVGLVLSAKLFGQHP